MPLPIPSNTRIPERVGGRVRPPDDLYFLPLTRMVYNSDLITPGSHSAYDVEQILTNLGITFYDTVKSRVYGSDGGWDFVYIHLANATDMVNRSVIVTDYLVGLGYEMHYSPYWGVLAYRKPV